jgi:hypothetical protein
MVEVEENEVAGLVERCSKVDVKVDYTIKALLILFDIQQFRLIHF